MTNEGEGGIAPAVLGSITRDAEGLYRLTYYDPLIDRTITLRSDGLMELFTWASLLSRALFHAIQDAKKADEVDRWLADRSWAELIELYGGAREHECEQSEVRIDGVLFDPTVPLTAGWRDLRVATARGRA